MTCNIFWLILIQVILIHPKYYCRFIYDVKDTEKQSMKCRFKLEASAARWLFGRFNRSCNELLSLTPHYLFILNWPLCFFLHVTAALGLYVPVCAPRHCRGPKTWPAISVSVSLWQTVIITFPSLARWLLGRAAGRVINEVGRDSNQARCSEFFAQNLSLWGFVLIWHVLRYFGFSMITQKLDQIDVIAEIQRRQKTVIFFFYYSIFCI